MIRDRYGDMAEAFLALYPSADVGESVLAASRDALYGWTSERLARSQTAAGHPSFLYLFDHGYPATEAANLHGFHASELPYMFGTLERTPPRWPAIPDTPDERRLSDAMVGYWTSFARTGQPVAANAPDWTPYGEASSWMIFRDQPAPEQAVFPGMFELHEQTMCRRRATGSLGWNWNTGLASPPMPATAPGC